MVGCYNAGMSRHRLSWTSLQLAFVAVASLTAVVVGMIVVEVMAAPKAFLLGQALVAPAAAWVMLRIERRHDRP
jgi:hypothetical protein